MREILEQNEEVRAESREQSRGAKSLFVCFFFLGEAGEDGGL